MNRKYSSQYNANTSKMQQNQSMYGKKLNANKSQSNFPSIEQSTQGQTFYSKKDSSIHQLEKRVPKSILVELQQNDSDFFLTIQDSLQNKSRRNQSDQMKLKPLLKKKEKKIDLVIQSVEKAVEKLRSNMKPEKRQLNNISDSDSDLDMMPVTTQNSRKKPKNLNNGRTLKTDKSSNAKYQNLMSDMPDPDKSLGGYANRSSKLNNNGTSYDDRAQQIISMQETIGEGLSKYNNLVRELDLRQTKLKELLKLIQDSENELASMRQFNDIINGNGHALAGDIEKNLSLLDEQRQYRQTLWNMKTNKRVDTDLSKKRCEELKELNSQFDTFLIKETQNLVYDAKKLDLIRTQYQNEVYSKDKNEYRLEKALKDHAKILKEEEEVIQVIQMEQAAQDELDNLKKADQAQKKQKYKEESALIKNQIKQEKNNLVELEEEFYRLKSQLNGINTIYDLLPQLEDLRETNKFCTEKKKNMVDQMATLRQQIKEDQEKLYQSKCKSVSIPKEDQLVVEFEETTIEKTEKQYEQLLEETQKAKESEKFLKKTLSKIDRGLKNMFESLLQSKIPELKQMPNLEKKTVGEVSVEVIKGLRGLMTNLEEKNIDEAKIEEFLIRKYKELDQEDDSLIDINDIEEPNSDSSDDFGQSQAEILDTSAK